jgi:hypothetical protein
MDHDCTLNQSDLAGYAMTQLEMAKDIKPPVVAGFFNGAEGDVSPRWVAQIAAMSSDSAARWPTR